MASIITVRVIIALLIRGINDSGQCSAKIVPFMCQIRENGQINFHALITDKTGIFK